MIVLFSTFGVFGYICFRDQTSPIFTLSLHSIDSFFSVIILGACINAFISYPVQILCAFDIMEQAECLKSSERAMSIIARSVVVCSITALALIIPNFTDFINIAGAVGAGLVAFIFPPLLYNITFAETISATKLIVNYGLMIFGMVGATVSIITSVKSITQD